MDVVTVAVIHADVDAGWADDVAQWLRDFAQVAMDRPDTVNVLVGQPARDAAAAVESVIYLASPAARAVAGLAEVAQDALAADIPVFTTWRAADGSAGALLPPLLEHINATEWTPDPAVLGAYILAACGHAENERRLFLSYRQTETAQLAEQLHTALTQAGFDVFLDRFSVPPGLDFQKKLKEDLADKAFVLVLESPGFVGREWTDFEISYATSHRLGLLALALPDLPHDRQVGAIDDAFRLNLDETDFDGVALSEDALDRLLVKVEREHAAALRRRREQMLGSIREKLLSDGCDVRAAGAWALLAYRAGHVPGVFLVTPRRPRPRDLLALHQAREAILTSIDEPLDATIVHEVPDISEADRELLGWIAEPRSFQSVLWQECALQEESV